jgi:small subunit ribosomal protein S28e
MPHTPVPEPAPGHFNVLYFATASTFTGKDHEMLPASLRLGDLFSQLEETYPGFARILDSCLVTRNLDYVDPGEQADVMIQDRDEIAILPPVSSG